MDRNQKHNRNKNVININEKLEQSCQDINILLPEYEKLQL